MSYELTKEAIEEALRDSGLWANGGVGKEALRETLREELDLHGVFTNTKYLREGVDGHFNANLYNTTDGTRIVDASDYWSYPTGLICPENEDVVISSKRAFKNGLLSMRTVLPDLTGTARYCFFGFENGSGGGNGSAYFRYSAGPTLEAVVVGNLGFSSTIIDISSLLPADYLIEQHAYTIYVSKNIVEFLIDSTIVAVILASPNLNITTIAQPPYAIGDSNIQVFPSMLTFIAVAAGTATVTFPLAPWRFRPADGQPISSRVYRLYETGTNNLLAASIIAAGSVTSHPIPVFGYDMRTLLFQATQAGTFLIEILTQTGNWRVYDTLPILANTLAIYRMTGEVVLARVTFTPSAYPCTISDAEVALR